MRKCKAVLLGSVLRCKPSADSSYLLDVLWFAIRFVYSIVHTCLGATEDTTCSVSVSDASRTLFINGDSKTVTVWIRSALMFREVLAFFSFQFQFSIYSRKRTLPHDGYPDQLGPLGKFF